MKKLLALLAFPLLANADPIDGVIICTAFQVSTYHYAGCQDQGISRTAENQIKLKDYFNKYKPHPSTKLVRVSFVNNEWHMYYQN